MRSTIVPLLLAVYCGAVLAQATAPQHPAAPDVKLAPQQRIERIHHEDAGSTIDELRYGGETQSITVQPKANVPPYEIQPNDGTHGEPALRGGAGPAPAGQRVWKVLSY
ncbi:MAG: hypothetical protein EPN79_01775 [Burkholderiaceae bacterium]|jgi:hypothetical protein|nr:MAG: hypothetical protein EPN79_01775 [Burkholderiaceae bacterium]TBR77846.1 MAG: hypothetical protein EPN64_00170 [Burkholderiaceae bacterium]